MKHVDARRKKVAISLNNLYTSGIISTQMSIPTKLKLFKIYIKPLLTYGCELLDLDSNELGELKKCEGNAIKQIIGIAKRCHTSPLLYGALDMESTANSIMIQQMKFIKRIQSNEYLKEFLDESRSIKNNSGLVGRLINNNNWDSSISVDQLNTLIDEKLNVLATQRKETYNESNESIEIKKILDIKNHFLKIFTLNCMLHYTSYGTTAQNQINEAIKNLNAITTTQLQIQSQINNQ